MTEAGGRKLITSNRRALHDYEILETFEAGIELAEPCRDPRVVELIVSEIGRLSASFRGYEVPRRVHLITAVATNYSRLGCAHLWPAAEHSGCACACVHKLCHVAAARVLDKDAQHTHAQSSVLHVIQNLGLSGRTA